MTVDQLPTLPSVRDNGFWDGVEHSYIPASELKLPPSLRCYEAQDVSVDPITYEVVRYSLVNANLEHSALLQRLCISPIVMLSRDLQTSILTGLGDLVVLSPNLQYFSNSHALAIKFTLEHRGVSPGIHDGDVFLSNDPFVGAPHQPDMALLAPIFVGAALFGWVANTMHYSDIGGSTPGSFCIDAVDTFSEPASSPPVKLVENGVVREDIEQLIARQSRLPTALRMDLRAGLAGIEVTRQRVAGLIDRYGPDVVAAVTNGMMDSAEAVFVERLHDIPDGRWSHRAYTEAAVPGDREVYAYQCAITKAGDRLIVDNLGSDTQTGSINITFAAFAGAVLAALTQQITSDLAGAYGGVYRRVEFRPEPGLVNCADWPAAVSPSGALTTEMQLNAAGIVVAKMLASGGEASARRILGPSIPHFYTALTGGARADGSMFIHANTDGMMGSLGAMPARDGVDAGGHFWIPDGIAANVEDNEQQYPMVVLYRRLLEGGADGAGRHRGGLGFIEAAIPYRALVFQLALYLNDSFPKGLGLLGANPGSRASFRFRSGTEVRARLAAGLVPTSLDDLAGSEAPAAFKGPPLLAGDDDAWEWVSPSTGGWGDPLLREPIDVLGDIRRRVLDVATAKRVYGVIVADDEVVDSATSACRLDRRRQRLDGVEPEDLRQPHRSDGTVGDLLHVVNGRWWCNGADLGPVQTTYKDAAPMRECRVRDIAAEFDAADHEMADRMVFREWFCPVTGYRIDTEICRAGEPSLADILLHT